MGEYTGLVAVIPSSVSSDGLPIKIATTSSPGTLLHTAAAGTAEIDTVVLYPFNRHSATVTLTFEVTSAAGASAVGEQCPIQVRASERAAPVIFRVQNGLKIRAFCSVVDVTSVVPATDRYQN